VEHPKVTMTLLKKAQKSGRKFLNPVPTAVGGLSTMWKVLPQYLKNKAEVEPKEPLGPFRTDARVYGTKAKSGLRVTWFGHSASLVEIDGARVLIDPVWDKRASPFRFMGPKRFFAPTIPLEELPNLDVVLISHDHYDHLGADTVQALASSKVAAKATWMTSLGVGRRLRNFGVAAERIVELDWTESAQVGTLTLTAWPARHFSGRGLLDRFTTLWGSFVIQGPKHTIYYGADSGYWDGFAEIAAQYGGFDLTMLEIGAFNSAWDSIHLGPANAGRAFEAMGKRGLLMPIHWGLFNLALHGWKDPIREMIEIAKERELPLWFPKPGVPTEIEVGVARGDVWWDLAH
jgi:L-ascorbate metabolism protein UlaG (beta-lactamase superfamily)